MSWMTQPSISCSPYMMSYESKYRQAKPQRLACRMLTSFKAVRLVRDLPFDVTAWRCRSTAASVVVGTVGDVLFGNLGTSALVNFLPAYLACELLTELDAYRCTQTASALVGCQHLSRCNGLVPCLSSVSFTEAFKLG